ncbi:protein RRP5 homolog [Anas platyrhynchos]|uniref:Protein RRP5 homolog n=1 Tax=Anas platyrhynchos platyrhynchos TaxID=8840 RepID=U3IS94_ANAPP|nr:protein RRP5 homolog [Anas platyrhynchos]XP_027316495.1 protein RRP5 homolog [Anas platyrhynchos]XP_038037631.1 protein RRP5 homolog [Anas platyrhynchos]|eukprot:XP_027316494.1 protein RRP5 homolog [Anas platyrhynchos]
MASIEENFPRGGIQKKPTEKTGKAPKPTTEQDNLFDVRHEEQSQKRKRNQEDLGKRKKFKADRKAGAKDNTMNIEPLTIEHLCEGMLLLGCIKEVSDFELVISLPNGLTGFVPVTQISDAYSKMLSKQVAQGEVLEDLHSLLDMYSPGMLVRCIVTSVEKSADGRRSIKLSINPKNVNRGLNASALTSGMLLSGFVSSAEDHGYLIDIGVNGTHAFLPRQKAQNYIKAVKRGPDLKIGQNLNCVIEQVKNEGRIVRLSVDRSEVAASLATEQQNWTLSNLLPGLVVKAKVQKVDPLGISLTFLSSFTGIVDFMHVDPDKSINYSPNQVVKACILSVHPTSKVVRLTLRQSFLNPGGSPNQLSNDRIGAVVEESTVKAFYKQFGAIFELDDGTHAFARLKHLSKNRKSFKPAAFKAGCKHKCRIIDYSLMDEMCILSLKYQVIGARFLQYQDIHTGDVVQGRVLALKPIGMQVKVTDGIKGLVPSLHLADVILKQPEKKYNVGDEVKCRVLECNPAEKKLFLTLKKTLIQSKLPILSKYEDAEPGLITHGFVVCAREFGCIVKFYNDVKGLVPKNELSAEPISCPDKVFQEGQVVKVMVLKCEPEQERLLLSFKLSSTSAPEGKSEHTPKKKQEVKYQIGEMVDVKVLKKKENGLEVSILEDEGNVIASLPTVYLSDFVANCKLLWHCLQEGDVLPRVMCLSDKGDRIILCRKSAVISAVQEEQVVRNFSEIQPGMLLTGYVRNVMHFGVFVEFPFGVTGLAPKVSMSDKFVTDTKDHFVVGQTVIAKVMSTDEEKQRVLLNLKVSECSSGNPAAESFSLLNQYFKEVKEIRNLLKRRESGIARSLCELMPGKELQLVVQDVKEDGSALFSGSCVKGLTVTATRYHLGDKSIAPGEKTKGLVLHVDVLTSKVYVSLREELLKQRPKQQLKENSQHSAIVQHIAEEFAIVSLETGQLAAIPIASHFNDTFRFDSEKLKVGQTIYATLKMVKVNDHGVVLAVQDPAKKNVFVRVRKESETTLEEMLAAAVTHSLSVGDIVTGTVKSVKPTHVTVAIDDKLTGSIHASRILDEVPIDSFPTHTLKAGQKVTARVIGGRDVNTHRYLPITHPHFTRSIPELSIRPSEIEGKAETLKDGTLKKPELYNVGQTVTCFVKKYNVLKNWLEVEVSPDIRGRVPHLMLSPSTKVLKHPEKNFKNGQALSATVTGTGVTETNLFLSLIGIPSLQQGTITVGVIAKMIPHVGLTITLPGGKTGKVSIFHLSDKYTENPLSDFKVGKVVRCYILANENGKIQLSLRQSRLNPRNSSKVEDPEIMSTKDVKKGQLVRGYVKSVTPSGVFFGLSASLQGRILFQNVSIYYVQKHSLYEKYLPEGKFLTAKVLGVNKKENHIELSLLPEDTGMPSVLPESLGLPRYSAEEEKREEEKREEDKEKKEEHKLKTKRRRKSSEIEQEAKPKKRKVCPTDENDSGIEVYYREEEDGDQEEEAAENKSKLRKRGEAPRLQVSTGFTWDEDMKAVDMAVLNQKEESSESEEEEENPQSKPKKQTKKEKELEKQKKEKELCKLEAALMDPSRQPQSADDFDRLVLSSPDSSILWLQYMAFHLQATEIEKARAVAERALKTICFREEQEKLNVWVALLNLENMYGTEETLMKVFERAVQYNEPLKVFQHLCDIYANSEKYKQAEELYHTMLRRFRQEKSVWLKYASFLLKQGQTEATHRLLERALKALPTKEHVDVISRFAQLEFRFGDTEHAKALFDSTLNSYPKRTDIWSIYMDIMIKHGSQKEVRDIFEKVIHLNLAPKKMKFFFKRYLDYEKKYGTEETILAVKTAALEYVEAKSSLADA